MSFCLFVNALYEHNVRKTHRSVYIAEIGCYDDCCVSCGWVTGWLTVTTALFHMVDLLWRLLSFRWLSCCNDCSVSYGWLTVTTALFHMVDLLLRLLSFIWLTYCDDCSISYGWLTVTTALFHMADLLWRLLCFRLLTYLWRLLSFIWLTYCGDRCVSDCWLTVTTALFHMVDLLWRLLSFIWLTYCGDRCVSDGWDTMTATGLRQLWRCTSIILLSLTGYVMSSFVFRSKLILQRVDIVNQHYSHGYILVHFLCVSDSCVHLACLPYLYTFSWGLILVISHVFISCVFLTLVYIQYVRIRLLLFLSEGVGFDTCTYVWFWYMHISHLYIYCLISVVTRVHFLSPDVRYRTCISSIDYVSSGWYTSWQGSFVYIDMHTCVLAIIPTCTLPVGCAEFCDILFTSYELSVVIIVHFLWAVRVLRYLTFSVSCVLWCLDIPVSCVSWYFVHFLWAFCCDICTLPVSCTCVATFDTLCGRCCDGMYVVIFVHFLWTVCCDICTLPVDCMLWYLYISCGLYVVILVHFLRTVCCDICTLPADCTSCGLYVVIFVHLRQTVCCDICTPPADCILWYSYTSCGLCAVVFAPP